MVGASWVGFVIETLVSRLPDGSEASHYRSSGGAEIDLVVTLPGRGPWAIEVKRSLNPRPRKGFHSGCSDVRPESKFVVYPEQSATGSHRIPKLYRCSTWRKRRAEPHDPRASVLEVLPLPHIAAAPMGLPGVRNVTQP